MAAKLSEKGKKTQSKKGKNKKEDKGKKQDKADKGGKGEKEYKGRKEEIEEKKICNSWPYDSSRVPYSNQDFLWCCLSRLEWCYLGASSPCRR